MQPFVVKLHGLGPALTEFDRRIGREFFESFGNPDVLDADFDACSDVYLRGDTVHIDCSIMGEITVPCDRCLEPLELSVDTGFSLDFSPEGDELDFNQEVYDYICTALPMQRVHPEGECNQETTKFLSK